MVHPHAPGVVIDGLPLLYEKTGGVAKILKKRETRTASACSAYRKPSGIAPEGDGG
jgi:hypothetical protein